MCYSVLGIHRPHDELWNNFLTVFITTANTAVHDCDKTIDFTHTL